MNVKIISLLCTKYVHVMAIYYVQLLYFHIMFKKCHDHNKIILVRDKKNKTKKHLRMKTPFFYFIRTKIKICYIYGDEKLSNYVS